jgi:hypothetical protein
MATSVRKPAHEVATDLLKLAGWAALLGPAGIVLHELGHFAVGWFLGFPVRLNVGSVSGGPELGAAPDWAVALMASAGPLVTIALMAIAAIGLMRRPLSKWALALAITAPLRFLVGGTYLYWVIKAWLENSVFSGTPNFDEYNAALALGLSPVWLLAVQMIALVCYWLWSASRPSRGRRLLNVGSVLIGAMAGITIWMALAGPALLAFL